MIALLLPLACATCQTAPGTTATQAANGAVLFMLGVLAIVFGGFAAMVISFVRRARRHSSEFPAEQ